MKLSHPNMIPRPVLHMVAAMARLQLAGYRPENIAISHCRSGNGDTDTIRPVTIGNFLAIEMVSLGESVRGVDEIRDPGIYYFLPQDVIDIALQAPTWKPPKSPF